MLSCFLLSSTLYLIVCGTPQTWSVGDESLLLRLSLTADGSLEESCAVDGVELPYQGTPGALQLADRDWTTLRTGDVVVEGPLDARGVCRRLEFRGTMPGLAWRLAYAHSGPGMVTKELSVGSDSDTVLEHVAMAAFQSSPAADIVSTGLQDIAAFIRQGDHGAFVSLDFPYSRITTEDGLTRVTYPPYQRLRAGVPYTCHTLTIGATRSGGQSRYGRDTGEVAAMDAYVQARYPQRFERPMFVSACINNRYTMPQAGLVWYTYKDHPTLSFNTDLMKRELELMPQLGMEYYQVFPGVFDWVADDPNRRTVHELVRYANEHGVRVGDYSGTGQVFCPHYNEYNNFLDRPEWRARDAQGNAGAFCFGSDGFVDYYTNTVVSAAKEFGFELHCLDFLNIVPCFATDHGHPSGDESIYHQVRGLVRIMEALAAVDPDMMAWSNSGNWSEFLPKIAWSNPNLYLTDPGIGTPWQGLNMTRLLDDARREQMVSLHYSRFVPYRYYTNCQYFFSQNSIVPDIRNYRYGALASLAVTPNLCLAEVRPWLDRLPASQQEEVKAFYARWTGFLQDNFELWKRTWHVGGDPASGDVEIYGHADGDHGYVFLVNPYYWNETVEVPLDTRLGFDGAGLCEIRELYPVDQLVLTPQGATPPLGSSITVEVPAQQVTVLEVQPAPKTVQSPRVYGIPATIEKSPGGYVLRTSGPQGSTHRFAVRAPDGESSLTSATVRPDEPKQAKRLFAETPLRVLGKDGAATLFEITFRRTLAPNVLGNWRARLGDLASGESQSWPQGFSDASACVFPLVKDTGPLANFCGGYVENAFSELQDTVIDLSQGDALAFPDTAVADAIPTPVVSPGPIGTQDAWWLSTTFHLPFMYTIGAEPAFDEHTLLVFPVRDPSRVRDLRAWMNGTPLDVRRYAYPRNRALSTFWADLVGSAAYGGDNVLVVYVDFQPGQS